MTDITRRIIIVIPANLLATGNNLGRQVTGQTGDTFRRGLSPTGNLPITHYIANWACTQQQYDQITTRFGDNTDQKPGSVFDATNVSGDDMPAFTEQILTSLGLTWYRPPYPF